MITAFIVGLVIGAIIGCSFGMWLAFTIDGEPAEDDEDFYEREN